jgi:hypothetical protein
LKKKNNNNYFFKRKRKKRKLLYQGKAGGAVKAPGKKVFTDKNPIN